MDGELTNSPSPPTPAPTIAGSETLQAAEAEARDALARLLPHHQQFAVSYAELGDKSAAYRGMHSGEEINKSGYARASAWGRRTDVKRAVDALVAVRTLKALPNRDDLITAIASAALLDPLALQDGDGKALPLREIPYVVRLAIGGLESKTVTRTRGKASVTETVTTYKLVDKSKAQDLLSRIMGLLAADNLQHGAAVGAGLTGLIHAMQRENSIEPGD